MSSVAVDDGLLLMLRMGIKKEDVEELEEVDVLGL